MLNTHFDGGSSEWRRLVNSWIASSEKLIINNILQRDHVTNLNEGLLLIRVSSFFSPLHSFAEVESPSALDNIYIHADDDFDDFY